MVLVEYEVYLTIQFSLYFHDCNHQYFKIPVCRVK